MVETTPVIICNEPSLALYGILRHTKGKKLVILLPAITGTRHGPQEIYVKIARELSVVDVASFCVDLPPNGDSYNNEPINFQGNNNKLISYYDYYINVIIKYFNANFKYDEYILLSISLGCMPVLTYSETNAFSKVILLSPNNLNKEQPILNKKNVRAYKEKFFRIETWLKLVQFDVDFKKILNNLFNFSVINRSGRKVPSNTQFVDSPRVNILNIFGGKDDDLSANRSYWMRYNTERKCLSYTEHIIEGADHNFFGWYFKQEVCDKITSWIKQTIAE